MFELTDYLHNFGWEYRERNGEMYIRYCPECEKQDEGDFTHLSFRADNGLFRCKKCDYHGNLWKFANDRGHNITKAARKEYVRPAENPKLLTDTEKFYLWYEKERGIKPEILKAYRVGLHKADNKGFIVYQFYNEHGHLINRKYRGCLNKKEQWQEKGAEAIYYGLDKIDLTARILFVCEGEDDCHALAQIGLKNVVSVPHGAGNYTPAMDKINREMDLLVLLFDNDPIGQAGARKFAEKAGLHKCVNVVLPYKDAREWLRNGATLEQVEKLCNDAKRFEMTEIVKAGELKDELSRKQSIHTQCGVLNRFFGGIRGGEMTIWTGHTGHGKTTAAFNLAYMLAKVEEPVLIMSFENTLGSTLKKFMEIHTGEAMYCEDPISGKIHCTKTDEWIANSVNALDKMPIYFLNPKTKNGYYNISDVRKVIEYAVKFFDIKLAIIDHLHYILKIKDPKSQTHEIDESIREISAIAKELETHLILIAHPYKTENPQTGKLAKLGLYCIKGSSAIAQEAHNFVVINRLEGGSEWRMIKSREWKLGKIEFGVSENGNTFINAKDVGGIEFKNKIDNGNKVDNKTSNW